MKQYIVDAFTDRPFAGNPAAVCGSAHCQIADYWAGVLGRKKIDAWQASARGGRLYCELLDGGRIALSGAAVLVAVSEIVAELI